MSGQTAQVQIEGETGDGVRLEVASEEVGDGLKVQFAMHAKEQKQTYEVKTAVLVEPGQTIVLNASPLPAAQEEAQSQPRSLYVVITPEVVK
jgi:hypothetical protein